jgi:hypothetical protein
MLPYGNTSLVVKVTKLVGWDRIPLTLFIHLQSMSFETIVLCDLSNVIKRILVVNVACDYKLVTKINRRKTFFYQCIGLSCARIILNMQGNVFGLHLVWRASFGHGWRRKPLTWIMWIIKIWPWYVFYRTSCYARYYECAS